MIRVRRLVGVGMLVAAGAVPIAARPAGATATEVAPVALATTIGTADGSVASLAVADQAGTGIDPALGVRFGPQKYVGTRTYTVPAAVDRATIWGLTVSAHVLSPTKAQQTWTWHLYNFRLKRWQKVGDNFEIQTVGPWRTLEFFVGGTLSDYVDAVTREVRVRTTGAKKPTVLWLDAESVRVEHGALPTHPGWKPPVGIRWQYQLQPPVDVDVCGVPFGGGACVRPQVFDIDLYAADGVTPDAATVAAIHADGARAVCYVSAGSWEDWRPDAGAFPAVVLGRSNGWPGEKWVDIRRLDVLVPIMSARAAACVAAGFDAVEWDNMDGYSNRTGFKLSPADQIRFNRAMAIVAHAHGLSVGLKNDVEQLVQLMPWFDFAVNEQCQQYSECDGYNAWTAAGKAVAQVEYSSPAATFCPPAIANGRSAIKKNLDLLALPYTPCA